MNKFVVGTIVALMPFTASFAGGVNVNAHRVSAIAPTFSVLPAARFEGLAVAPQLSGLGKLPGLGPLVGPQPAGPLWARNGWLPYDVHVWPGEVQSYALTEKGIFLAGIGGMISDFTRITCTDCGGPIQEVQFGIDTGLASLGSGLTIPTPHPHFPAGLEPFAELVFGAVDQTLNTVGNIVIGLGGGGGGT